MSTIATNPAASSAERTRLTRALERLRLEPKCEGQRRPTAPPPGVSTVQAAVLRAIVSAGGYRPGGSWLNRTELAIRATMPRRTLDEAIVALKAKGWVHEGPRCDGQDGKALHVVVVEADLMSDEEIAGMVAAEREAAADRKARYRAKRATVSHGADVGRPTGGTGDTDDLSHGESVSCPTGRAGLSHALPLLNHKN